MAKPVRSRWWLVVFIAAGQLLALTVASVWLVRWLDLRLNMHLEEGALSEQAIKLLTRELRGTVIVLSIGLVFFSVALTAAIIRRYENRLGSINKDLEKTIAIRTSELLKSRSAVIFGLAKLAESRDDQTGQHLERIRKYVQILGTEIGRMSPDLSQDFVETLADTSSLHDIGKVGIPDSVLLHPGPLNDAQREIIRKHPGIGGDTLLALKQRWGDDPFLVTACEIAFAHHERWDGEGYPFGLKGEDIPLSARVVALADVYDALTSKRVYKDALSHEDAMTIITAGKGTHFDPMVVDAFVRRENDFRAVRRSIDAVAGAGTFMRNAS
jgi:response regulator RpfG family c-di-GMP phosphodiesterase